MFVAVWPDDPTVLRLSALELPSVSGLTTVRPEQWHVTLRFLGEVDDALCPMVVEALALVATSVTGPVRCALGPATTWFSGARVLQVPVAGLDKIAEAVRRVTAPLVPGGGQAPYVGHLTIARVRGRRPASSTRTDLAGIAFAAEFVVGHLLLVASALSPEGPRYATLARLPLPT
jgi:RNA 2',3'-cyclic 3'-phosphodiesterase